MLECKRLELEIAIGSFVTWLPYRRMQQQAHNGRYFIPFQHRARLICSFNTISLHHRNESSVFCYRYSKVMCILGWIPRFRRPARFSLNENFDFHCTKLSAMVNYSWSEQMLPIQTVSKKITSSDIFLHFGSFIVLIFGKHIARIKKNRKAQRVSSVKST